MRIINENAIFSQNNKESPLGVVVYSVMHAPDTLQNYSGFSELKLLKNVADYKYQVFGYHELYFSISKVDIQ